jgi:crotonobetainyl-CoA:carnitine CoA-transferase CaiB-like acyl-CoA transferase
VSWIEGGVDDGGTPHWPSVSIGDTGNGFVWATAVVQAIYHRDRTGEGQMLDTAIVNAHLLNASMAWITTDGGSVADRPKLDRMTLGFNALYRLYEGDDGWLCLAAVTDDHWAKLCQALQRHDLATEVRFATAAARAEHDAALSEIIGEALTGRPVQDVWQTLDDAGVPCEISSPDFILRFFDDPANAERQWITTYQDPLGGTTTASGLLADFSETPGKVWGPPLVIGDHTRDILVELGYDAERIDKLCAQGTVLDAADGTN